MNAVRVLLVEVITDGLQIDWYTDFYYPLVKKWAERVRSVSSPDKIVLCEPIPNEV